MAYRSQDSIYHVSYNPIDVGANFSPPRPVSPESPRGGSEDLAVRSHPFSHLDTPGFASPSPSIHKFQSGFQEDDEAHLSVRVLSHVDSDYDGPRLVGSDMPGLKPHFGKAEQLHIQTTPLLQSRKRLIVFVGLALSWLAVSIT